MKASSDCFFYLSAEFGRRLGELAPGRARLLTVYNVQRQRFTHFLHGGPVLKSKVTKASVKATSLGCGISLEESTLVRKTEDLRVEPKLKACV